MGQAELVNKRLMDRVLMTNETVGMGKGVKPTSLYIDPETTQQLKEAALKSERSVSWLVRKAIKEYLAANNYS